MDYGTKILKKLIKELKDKPIEELEKEAAEADIKYLKILQKAEISSETIR